MRKLTELEGCVLGNVRERGPCTAYVLRQAFLRSPSPHWSGSAGAIYPLVERLARQGLLRTMDLTTGRRRGRGYVLTPDGLQRFLEWLGPPLSDETVAVPMDPLRTRLRFLDALSPEQRAAFLADATAKMRQHVRRLEEAYGQPDSLFDELAGRGAFATMQARLKWLGEIGPEAKRRSTR